MDSKKDLTPHFRGPYSLVGQFFYFWGVMDSAVSLTLQMALRLTTVQGTIICRNMQLQDRLNALRTISNFLLRHQEGTRRRFDKVIKDIVKMLSTRNMIAHTLFMPSDDHDTVQFYVTNAKNKLEFPVQQWDEAKFRRTFKEIERLTSELEALGSALINMNLANALKEASERETRGLFGLLNLPASAFTKADD